jgi:hypothetical protein
VASVGSSFPIIYIPDPQLLISDIALDIALPCTTDTAALQQGQLA